MANAARARESAGSSRLPDLALTISFALAVVLTPAVILKEGFRLFKSHEASLLVTNNLVSIVWPSLLGMVFSFIAGLVALKWLSGWLENGKWHFFGYYCLSASIAVLAINHFLP